ncbi:PREDICTED: uncharacterized protein LOC109580971 [Amphimedon queenslandica]|uniref:FZ domain-containing protein n=1 Tax=Amphimedon queenslandica TaxID=400682 RepID=A0A1X7V8V6_AMPQE|nr:PREDICTED: uncharacterized protein LOC109580971 [Amphimedon queenslandica]XP_019850176.1 PREDICTED: uncharacterized protein LOC109580971 [Amphimedon queenslandica]XP_019850177.1 PREDICTED: uncharacterized protein LOC109580971 [Amphimedon queenslandica]|eukprot:XP_019850175.1 PREDICTED: uncharacterized protein LOC109580971 [Amphimedon queenslandica]
MATVNSDSPSISNSKQPLVVNRDNSEKIEMSLSTTAAAGFESTGGSKNEKDTNSWDCRTTQVDRIKFCGCCLMPSRLAKFLEIAILITVLLFFVALFLVPIGIHIKESISSSFKEAKCSAYGLKEPSNCDTLAQTVSSNLDSCTPVHYIGSTCKAFLSKWQSCTIGYNEDIFISSSSDQNNKEEQAKFLLEALQSPDVKEDCRIAGTMFVCQFSFPLCNCSNGEEYLPSREFCSYVSTDVCATEWDYAYENGIQTPNCSDFISSGIPINSSTGNMPILNISHCSEDFYQHNGSGPCRPICGSYETYSELNAKIETDTQLAVAVFVLFMGIIVLIASFIRRKIMLIFPSIFLIYLTIGVCVVAIFVIIPKLDKTNSLFCTSKDLLETYKSNSTTYCKVTGAVFQYFFLNMTLWWFFHVMSIFYKIMFPVFAKTHKDKDKFIHIVLLILGVTFPVPGVLLALLVKDWGSYALYSMPTYFCVPRNSNLRYYSLIFPLNILLAIGVCCLVLVFWRLQKHQNIFFRKRNSPLKMTLAEMKLLFFLAYYSLFGLMMMSYFSVISSTQDKYVNSVAEYFECEAFGTHHNYNCSTTYEKYNYVPLAASTYILMGFITIIILIYVVNWRSVANFCVRKLYHYKGKVTNYSIIDDD